MLNKTTMSKLNSKEDTLNRINRLAKVLELTSGFSETSETQKATNSNIKEIYHIMKKLIKPGS